MDGNPHPRDVRDPDENLRLYLVERFERLVARRQAAARAGLLGTLRAFDRAICAAYEDCVALGAPDDHIAAIRFIARYPEK